MNLHYQKVTKYFNDKADKYDDVDKQLYWVLSDDFFKEVLRKELPALISNKDIKLLDAGAGTGRWTFFVHEIFKDKFNISGTLIDISEEMLKVAKNKFIDLNLDKNFNFIFGNIEDLSNLKDDFYNLSISFYNVINFVENPNKALAEINKKLIPGGVHVSVLTSKYHAYYFSILTNRLSQIDKIESESKIQFNDNMPPIFCFTPEEAKKLYISAGFSKVKIVGGPNFIYPGMEETKVIGSSKEIQNKLADQNFYSKILKLELDNYNNNDILGRANALLVIAQK
jgi:ubiquinone/menaquinone biosynthesis C-methylase UbiE